MQEIKTIIMEDKLVEWGKCITRENEIDSAKHSFYSN